MSKKLEKAYESLGLETVKELEAAAPDALKKRIVDANEAMRTALDELEGNEHYLAAKQSIKDLSAGRRELDKRQKAIILISLSLLNNER